MIIFCKNWYTVWNGRNLFLNYRSKSQTTTQQKKKWEIDSWVSELKARNKAGEDYVCLFSWLSIEMVDVWK